MKTIINLLLESYKNKLGNYSGRELTTFLFVMVILVSWTGSQFFGKEVPEFMFGSFVLIVLSGLGLYTLEKKQ